MEGLVEGRVVHFVLYNSKEDENYKHQGEVLVCRPAIIVNAWGGKLGDGMINIQVFLDGPNDYRLAEQKMIDTATVTKSLFRYNPRIEHKGIHQIKIEELDMPLQLWMTSVKYSENKEIGTWHWPERS